MGPGRTLAVRRRLPQEPHVLIYLALTDRQKPLPAVGRKSSTAKVLVAIAVEMLQSRGSGASACAAIDKDSVPSSRGMLFYGLLQQAVVTPPVTYEDVVRRAAQPKQQCLYTVYTYWVSC